MANCDESHTHHKIKNTCAVRVEDERETASEIDVSPWMLYGHGTISSAHPWWSIHAQYPHHSIAEAVGTFIHQAMKKDPQSKKRRKVFLQRAFNWILNIDIDPIRGRLVVSEHESIPCVSHRDVNPSTNCRIS